MNGKSITSGNESKRLCLCLLVGAAVILAGRSVAAQDNTLRIVPQGQLQPLTSSPAVTTRSTMQTSPLPPASLPAEAVADQSQPVRPWLQANESGAKEIDVPGMISKLAMSTMVVLCLCVAGLVIIKKFRGGMLTGITANAGSTANNDLAVEATLKLGGAGYLQIVRAGETRLVVACDASGIKSLQPIGSLFAQELEQEEIKSTQGGPRRTEPGSRIREPIPRFMHRRGVPDLH